ncbi:hypothetical protein PoB_001349200 [Plakobranchus ocellatus]|uniref:Uncharacterized protein n=1 Tax=Plakobranchus ocellatus TaxID=259542 RepID=A0AAV3YVI7_9GAST|nr:hypothetical protein PoB_001349200 [Plakobranchus ocellatus]
MSRSDSLWSVCEKRVSAQIDIELGHTVNATPWTSRTGHPRILSHCPARLSPCPSRIQCPRAGDRGGLFTGMGQQTLKTACRRENGPSRRGEMRFPPDGCLYNSTCRPRQHYRLELSWWLRYPICRILKASGTPGLRSDPASCKNFMGHYCLQAKRPPLFRRQLALYPRWVSSPNPRE